jgi:DNA-binding transcriptional ArsR family regulator
MSGRNVMNTSFRDAVGWQRLRDRLGRSDTWLIIALLALAGWTLDAALMFLAMHDSPSTGLVDFARHFWYAVPMTLAIVALSRLKARPELLGLTVYDEAGRVVHKHGDFHLDELAETGMLAALRSQGSRGLYSLALPTGPRMYFLRDGGLTWVLCFSGPASPEELRASVQGRRSELPHASFDLLFGLEPATAALAANLLSSPIKRATLAFLHLYKLMSIQVDDLAYRLRRGETEVTQALDDLVALGVVESECACDRTFYRLNREPAVLARLEDLFAWQGRWETDLRKLSDALGVR